MPMTMGLSSANVRSRTCQKSRIADPILSGISHQAGDGSGPPRNGGVRRGSSAGLGDACGVPPLIAPLTRGGNAPPFVRIVMSSRVNVSRSRSAAATACRRSMFVSSVCFAGDDLVVTTATDVRRGAMGVTGVPVPLAGCG